MKILVNGYFTGGNCPPFVHALAARNNEVLLTNTGLVSNGRFDNDPTLDPGMIHVPAYSSPTRMIIKILRKFRISLWTWLVIPKYKKLIHDLRPDLVINHKINIRSNIMIKTGFTPQVSYIYGSEVHGRGIISGKIRQVLEQSKYILTNTEEMRQFVLELNNHLADRVRYLPWGYPDQKMLDKVKKSNRSELRKKHDIPEGDFVVFDSRSLRHPDQTLDAILEGFRLFHGSHSNARLCFIRGFLGVPKALEKVREYIRMNPEIKNRIIILDGVINREKYMELLRLSDVFLSLLKGDQFGFSIFEAAVLKLNLVLTDLEVYRKNLGENPVYIPDPDKDSICKALEQSLSNSAVPDDNTVAGLTEMFRFDKCYDRINDFLNEVVQKK